MWEKSCAGEVKIPEFIELGKLDLQGDLRDFKSPENNKKSMDTDVRTRMDTSVLDKFRVRSEDECW